MYYVKDENGNKVEAFTKEEFLTFLQNAIENGSLAGIDAGSAIVSKLKCCVSGNTVKVAFVTQAKYNELKNAGLLESDCHYFKTDSLNEVFASIEALSERLESLGFNEGTFTATKTGNGSLEFSELNNLENKITKMGKYAIGSFYLTCNGLSGDVVTIKVPDEFKPKTNIPFHAKKSDYSYSTGYVDTVYSGQLKTDGTITITLTSVSTIIYLKNLGWEIA